MVICRAKYYPQKGYLKKKLDNTSGANGSIHTKNKIRRASRKKIMGKDDHHIFN